MMVPLPARDHDFRGLAAGEEAGEGGHLPHLAIDARGGLADREIHVCADVEDDDFERGDFGFDLFEQG